MQEYIKKLANQEILGSEEAKKALLTIGKGESNDSLTAAFIMAYVLRAITPEELEGFRNAMLELCVPIHLGIDNHIDLCGTGGDGKNTFNISTCSSFVVAAYGIPVTKHGNYGVSSAVGSSNVMEFLGYQFSNSQEQLKKELEECNITFLHAPLFHPAMKHVAPIRKNLGIKTFFNLLGPLSNPAQPTYQFTGVYHPDILPLYNYVLSKNTKNHNIVHAVDVFDEVSLTCPFYLVGKMHNELIHPQDLNLPQVTLSKISGGNDLQTSGEILVNILQGKGTKEQNNVVAVNAGIAIHTATNLSLNQSIQEALEIIQSGKAYQNLQNLIRCNQQ